MKSESDPELRLICPLIFSAKLLTNCKPNDDVFL
jgi:hypothetical protein